MAKWRIFVTLIVSFLVMLSVGIPQAAAQLITQEVVLGDGALGRYRAPERSGQCPTSHSLRSIEPRTIETTRQPRIWQIEASVLSASEPGSATAKLP